MPVAAAVVLCVASGFCAGLLAAYWWLNGYQRELTDRLRKIENEVLDTTREHWIEGVNSGQRDWDWPGRGY